MYNSDSRFNMDGGQTATELDQEFDQFLAGMKPCVLRLPKKSERQRCAVWIKKLCEPPSSNITGRKNRNMYAKLMLHMLKRGSLDGPFTRRPDPGALTTLPTYMSIYFDEPSTSHLTEDNPVPDWVNGELTDTIGSSLFRSSVGQPAASSTWRSGITRPERMTSSGNSPRRRAYTSLGVTLDRDPTHARHAVTPTRSDHLRKDDSRVTFSMDDISIGVKRTPRSALHFLSDDEDSLINQTSDKKKQKSKSNMKHPGSENPATDWRLGVPPASLSTNASSYQGLSLNRDESSQIRLSDKEVEFRCKMLQAKFHEEKLRLQQEHDTAVQKILDRKNIEIDDVKTHYKAKSKDTEESILKLDKKIQILLKDSSMMRESKDRQITELKRMLEETSDAKKAEFEKKLHDVVADFEQEKYDMQKQHTKNIQELLDDTNVRLQRMEEEYRQQTTATTSVIKELENRLHHLTAEADITTKARTQLENENIDLQTSIDGLMSELDDLKARHSQFEHSHHLAVETHEHQMRSMKNKCEASLEFAKQEHAISSAKAADTISDLEQQIDQLRKALKDSEDSNQRQIQSLEQSQEKDTIHRENLHDKQIRDLKKDIEQLEQESELKIKRLELVFREKDAEITRLKDQNNQQIIQADKSLSDFKAEVDKSQAQLFEEMKQQMERVESDLDRSKQMREKQGKEFGRHLEEEKIRHERENNEVKVAAENQKTQILRNFHLQKEHAHSEYEREVERFKESNRQEVHELDRRARERQDKDGKIIGGLEQQVRELRDEVVQSNQLRKQQLVELGLLREEEKQKMQRDFEVESTRLRADVDQQRLDLQKAHSAEMEKMLEKTNARLKEIEKDYTERAQKSNETVVDLHATINQLRDDLKRNKDTSDKKYSDSRTKYEDEKRASRRQYTSSLNALQQEAEAQHSKVRSLDRQVQKQEAEQEQRITELKLTYESKIRGLMPSSVRQELEDTISALKSQIHSLQQRTQLLQDELDSKPHFPLASFARTSSPIKSNV